jgi:hypothetical protein
MFTEVKLKDGNGTHYGLGVEVTERNGQRSIEHSGEVNGFVSDNEVLIDNRVAVAVTTNHMGGGAEEIAQLVAATVAGNPNEPPAETQARAIYSGLQKGEIDRSLLAPNLNDYFSAQIVDDFKSSLAPLGDPPIFHMTRESLRGGMTFRVFDIVYPGKKLRLTTYTYPDGKLEQYLIEPAD